jgi:hypothetical protein
VYVWISMEYTREKKLATMADATTLNHSIAASQKRYRRLADLAMDVISKTGRTSPCDCLLSDPSTMQRGRGSPAALAGLIRCTEYPRRGDSFVGKVAARQRKVALDHLHQQSHRHDDTRTCTVVIHRRQAHIAGAW